MTNVLLHMDKVNLSIDVVTVCHEQSIFTEKLEKCGIRFYELSGNRNHIKKNCKRFWKLLQERSYDVIHANVFHGGSLYYLYLAQKAGIPLRIAHSHNTQLRKGSLCGLKWMIHRWAKAHYGNCVTHRWACSREAAYFLYSETWGNRKTDCVIPNGIDLDRFRFCKAQRHAMRKKLDVEAKFVVGNVGRLCGQKNQAFLLHVFVELLQLEPKSVLLLVGEGEDHAKLTAKAKGLHIEDKVIFCGVSERVEQLLWAMDVFAFPSLFEGLGIAAVEAQAAGLPVVCADTVPQGAYILPSVRSMPLDCGASQWASALWACQGTVKNREACVELVGQQGFDVVDVAKKIKGVYQGDFIS